MATEAETTSSTSVIDLDNRIWYTGKTMSYTQCSSGGEREGGKVLSLSAPLVKV